MRVIKTETTVYSAKHLRRYYPGGFHRAHEHYRDNLDLGHVSDEMTDSLKGLADAAGVKLRDWSLGAYNRGNRLKVDFPQDGAEDLTGARAFAWLENNLFGPLRAPWGLLPVARFDKKLSHGVHNTRYHVSEGKVLSRWTRPGAVKDCPFTGTCYDLDFLEDIIKGVKSGRTLKEAFEDLADTFARIIEGEYEYQGEESTFLETADANAWEFEKDGSQVW
jgi:hypothetical protein